MAKDPVKDVEDFFSQGYQHLEEDLALARKKVRKLRERKSGRFWPQLSITGPILRLHYRIVWPRLAGRIRFARSRLHICKQVKADLARGDLRSAIDALLKLAPPKVPTWRHITGPVISAMDQDSTREAMLGSRDKLIKIQGEAVQVCY